MPVVLRSLAQRKYIDLNKVDRMPRKYLEIFTGHQKHDSFVLRSPAPAQQN